MSLFPEPDLAPQAARLTPNLHALAAEGIYFGTSSWKYEVQNSFRIPHPRLAAAAPKGYYLARDAQSKKASRVRLLSCDDLWPRSEDRLNDNSRQVELFPPNSVKPKAILLRARWPLGGLIVGLLFGIWVGGGTDRYGEGEGILGGVRGAYRTMVRGYRYSAATVADCVSPERHSVRNLGLVRQIENRIWQDKRLSAEAIVVEVEDGGKAVLTGQVPDATHKERAVALARDTRGVETVIDQLAVGTPSRTIDAAPSEAVPTGVATGARIVR
jgi:BON domain